MFFLALIVLIASDAYVSIKVKKNLVEANASLDRAFMWGNVQGMIYAFLLLLIMAFVK